MYCESNPGDSAATGNGHDSVKAATELAVLLSGGLDSAVLVGQSLSTHAAVHPLYVRCGLRWEADEVRQVRRFLAAITSPRLRPLTVLEMPVADLYDGHWSQSGPDVPDGQTPDEAVYLPGRNVLLLAKAILWCHLRGVPAVALASLKHNPFPDATPRFIENYRGAVNQAVEGAVEVLLPYAGLSKPEVLCLGSRLPLELTFSCLAPVAGEHCGRCNKCAERAKAFADAGLPDRTAYCFPCPATDTTERAPLEVPPAAPTR